MDDELEMGQSPVTLSLTDGYGESSITDNSVTGDSVWTDLFPVFIRLLRAKGYSISGKFEDTLLSFIEDESGLI